MESHTPYSDIFKRSPDFRVKYEFLPQDNGSPREIFQGRWFDFRYPNNGDLKNSHYIIRPEFEDNGGFTILDKWLLIEPSGTAKMWILNQELTNYHREHLKLGTVGYMTIGPDDIAICEVIELISLQEK